MNNMADIEKVVKGIIVEKLGVEESSIKPESHFINDLGADSLDTVELIMELEKAFDIKIEDSEAEKLTTVGETYKFIENLLSKGKE